MIVTVRVRLGGSLGLLLSGYNVMMNINIVNNPDILTMCDQENRDYDVLHYEIYQY